ncbi:IS5 family transposase [Roseomonas mucosa]|uniref:IS5 family transposase n=1 Tax=Roseomonas mucosa TaxID=207340 RepID=UPI0028CFD3E7|nr:IS5 family transposase [Roseomonas mucosa]MDT8316131.1 IS5 family transposase [Roseomonas mucosa]MDT8362916.1 IS5 family transposase [Roseomonas mucosa]
MKHRPRPPEQADLLRPRLLDMIDRRHELVRLAGLIDWSWFEREWAGFFPAAEGRPATHPRLVAGLMYLQHAHGLSDEAVLARWVENPYFQHFTGETFFQHRAPIHPSSLSRWRGRIGEEGVEWLLTKTIEAGCAAGAVSERSLAEIAVDTTVMEKAIAHPTDSRLYEKARRSLVALAGKAGISLRQNDNRLAPRLAVKAGRHAHARQFRRMRKALRTLKGYTGRVLRDVGRKLDAVPEGPLRARIEQRIALATRLLRQTPKATNKIYALHEPEVDCISKGKARVRYEFGTKVSVATTLAGGFVVGMRSMPGNPYDGHTLGEVLQQVETLTGCCPTLAVVDRGYRGHGVQGTTVLISGTRRGLTPRLRNLLRHRSAIEPEIGHMKSDGRLARCALKGTLGDALHAVLCGCGHNLRKILAYLRSLLAVLLATLLQSLTPTDRRLFCSPSV